LKMEFFFFVVVALPLALSADLPNNVLQPDMRAAVKESQWWNTTDNKEMALPLLASSCHIGNAIGCNTYQLPGVSSSFTPGQQLIAITADDVILGPGSGLDIGYNSNTFESTSAWSRESTSTFGAGATVPVAGAAFSGSVQHSSVVFQMMAGTTYNYFASADVKYSVWTAYINPSGPTRNLAEAVAALAPYSQDNQKDYFTLFSEWGTHFTSQINFGGFFTQSASINSVQAMQAGFSDELMSVGLGGSFGKLIGFNITSTSSLNQSAQDSFNSFSSYSSIHVFGGNETHLMVDEEWFESVQLGPKPMSSLLRFMGTLFTGQVSLSLAQAYSDYMQVCPLDASGVVCAGSGQCLFDNVPPKCICATTCIAPAIQTASCECQCPDIHKCKNGGTLNKDCTCTCSKTCFNCGVLDSDDCTCKCRGNSDHGWTGDLCESKYGHCVPGPGSGNPDGSCPSDSNQCRNSGGGASTACDITQVCCNTDMHSVCAPFGSTCSCGAFSCDVNRAQMCVEGAFDPNCACSSDP